MHVLLPPERCISRYGHSVEQRTSEKSLQYGFLWGTGRDNWQVYCGGNLLGSGTQAQSVHLAECSPFVLIHLFSESPQVTSGPRAVACPPSQPTSQPTIMAYRGFTPPSHKEKLREAMQWGWIRGWVHMVTHMSRFSLDIVLDSLCVRVSVWGYMHKVERGLDCMMVCVITYKDNYVLLYLWVSIYNRGLQSSITASSVSLLSVNNTKALELRIQTDPGSYPLPFHLVTHTHVRMHAGMHSQ